MRLTPLMRIIIPMVIAGMVLTACKKENPADPGELTVELEFVIQQTDFSDLKSTQQDFPRCNDQWSEDYVVFAFAGQEYWSPLFTVDGQILTQVVKVTVPQSGAQTYQLSKFLIYHDVQGNGPTGDDLLLRAAPEPNSTYHHLMVNKLNLDITVEAFMKTQVEIDVLCFEDLYYENFGFSWFELNQVRIERQCFFGDVCVDDPGLFDIEGSLYREQENGIQMDMPAIMEIHTYKKVDGEWEGPMNVFDNVKYEDGSDWYGEGACMEVFWANDEDLEEEFKFELYVHYPVDGDMEWVFIDEYIFFDDNCPDPGNDGVVDFVLGDCQLGQADYQYELPCQPVYFQDFGENFDGWNEYEGGTITVIGGVATMIGGAPYTNFGGYSDTWPGTWEARNDVYLDPAWTGGEGFDYSVAANGTDGAHERDFIFHVSKDISEGKLFVAASNNTNFATRQDLENINNVEITAAGWYTFQHIFYDDGGVLAVDLNLLDSEGNVLFTETRSNPADLIPSVVGGNRYGWFTFIDVSGGIQVDNTKLILECE